MIINGYNYHIYKLKTCLIGYLLNTTHFKGVLWLYYVSNIKTNGIAIGEKWGRWQLWPPTQNTKYFFASQKVMIDFSLHTGNKSKENPTNIEQQYYPTANTCIVKSLVR